MPALPARLERSRKARLALLSANVGLLTYIIFGVVPLSSEFNHLRGRHRSSDRVCEELTQWVIRQGGKIRGMECVNRPLSGGRGIVTSSQLFPQEPLFDLPNDVMFSSASVKKHSPRIFNILDSNPTLKKECGDKWGGNGTPCRLALALIYEATRKDKSFWPQSYFSSAPLRPTSAVWWNDTQLARFESDPVITRFKEYRDWHRRQYEATGLPMSKGHPDLWPAEVMTFERFVWAHLFIETRAFSCPSASMDKPSTSWCLVPFMDLINHQSYVESDYGVDSYIKGWFRCLVEEAYEPGSELYISYGSHHHTAHFLETYGFAPGGFEHMDMVSFVYRRKRSEDRKCKNGNEGDICKGDFVGVAGIDGCINHGKVDNAFLRKVASDLSGVKSSAVSADQLQAAKAYVTKAIDGALASFSTTYGEDSQKLVSGAITSYDEYAVLATRSRYKRVLHAVKDALGKSDDCVGLRWLESRRLGVSVSRNPSSQRGGFLYEVHLNP